MKNIEIILTSLCNINCVYCSSSYNKKITVFGVDTVKKILLWGNKNNVEGIFWGGGEPTLVESLPELTSFAKKLGYKNIVLRTNGIMLQEISCLNKLIENGINKIEISVNTTNPQINKELTDNDEAFKAQIRGIKNVVKNKIDLVLTILITTKNYKNIPNIVNFFNNLGVKNIRFGLISLFGLETQNISFLLPRIDDIIPYIIKTFSFVKKKKLNVTICHIPLCFLGARYRQYLFNPKEMDLLIIDPSGKFKLENTPFEGGVKKDECLQCTENKNCLGVRKDYLNIFNDTILQPIKN